MYVDDKNGKGTVLKCNHAGCTKQHKGANHADAWRKAKAAGWSTPNASTAFCPDHKPARATKASTKANGKKAAKGSKAGKGSKKPATLKATRKPGNVVSYTSVDAEA